MGLLNKKDKISPISPVIESRKWVYEQYDFENAMNDDMVYHKWIDCMKINNKKTLLVEWLQGFCSILPNFIPGADIIYSYSDRNLILNVLIQEKGRIRNFLTATCVLDEDYPEEYIAKLLNNSKGISCVGMI